ncbi:GNAT family N-acetyltransferase [Cryobacterium adonitolivorans]|uniref:GNAT family N-acetyltransferase n=1 Tax=Cryobacterium adonitolivorans TaxID=1259189 RepID=A0A4R8W864_9MICO|nr:GNAT family N-acetyltransferase [Cryobacterium adonitolivorans]TFC02089.1 GNAT family N-acetyltransferase [Cryobacterium adonitolivorans]
MALTVTREPPRQGDVDALLTLSGEFAAALYPPESNFLLSIDELEAPGVLFFVARTAAGGAVGTAAVVPLRPDDSGAITAELKRMFVHPEARGEGVAGLLLDAAEAAALAGGIRRMVLETGPLHVAALAFYRAHGYVEIPQYGQYVGEELSVCFGKDL